VISANTVSAWIFSRNVVLLLVNAKDGDADVMPMMIHEVE
jgi:hypothetical protein